MCGISGCVIHNSHHKFFDLLKTSDIRGADGTGISILMPEAPAALNITYPERASKVRGLDQVKLPVGTIILGHNRLATFGLTADNYQPLSNGNLSLVHNGNLFDFEDTFKRLNLERLKKIDTELIFRILERELNTISLTKSSFEYFQNMVAEVYRNVKGNFACLFLDCARRVLVGFTHYKPLFLYKDIDGNIYFFSTRRIGEKVFGKSQDMIEVPNDYWFVSMNGDIDYLDKIEL